MPYSRRWAWNKYHQNQEQPLQANQGSERLFCCISVIIVIAIIIAVIVVITIVIPISTVIGKIIIVGIAIIGISIIIIVVIICVAHDGFMIMFLRRLTVGSR